MAPIEMGDDPVVGSEADAVAADVGGAGHGHHERRLAARLERGRVDGGAAAREESAVRRKQEDDRRQPIHPGARRVADDAANGEPIADAFVSERDELERRWRGKA